MADRLSPIRPTDAEALRLARTLLRGARFGALGVIEPESGYPFASRVLLATDADGVPVMLSSQLSTHTRAVLADPRCSLLVGEPGRGDPLAWPRLTVLAEAERVAEDSESRVRIRQRFLNRHPKSKLYADFGDFSFFRLVPKSAAMNGGFGKAYKISGEELVIRNKATHAIAANELHFIDQINGLGERVPDLLVKHYFKEKTDNWRIVGVDVEGVELARKEKIFRVQLDASVEDPNALIDVYSRILKDIR
ncbi:HugZ family protein [Rhizobium sp. KVB221]|uniref:HugZ family protein n=1 Tax=Rhizobium setariae TaxID=2801340 RepID=A0A936YPX0_9HYPH|nr:pyridoxamine 5'-phosphate oxidase family protein [Rhizobium setariae]MBL0372049.1 HugZ family protein [Rhizobium setariae]